MATTDSTASRVGPRPVRGPADSASLFRTALIDLCFERGFAQLTIADLCRRSGVAPASFRRRYDDLEDCFFDVCRAEFRRYRRLADFARAGGGDWQARLRGTTYALYRFAGEDERLRRFALIEARAAGERPALLLAAELDAIYELIDEGRAEPGAPGTLTRATAESLGGGIYTQIYFAACRPGPLPPEDQLVPAMMYGAVLPYLGAAAAAEELRLPPPRFPPRPERGEAASIAG
jgi:AcrR family transcriptional regulator